MCNILQSMINTFRAGEMWLINRSSSECCQFTAWCLRSFISIKENIYSASLSKGMCTGFKRLGDTRTTHTSLLPCNIMQLGFDWLTGVSIIWTADLNVEALISHSSTETVTEEMVRVTSTLKLEVRPLDYYVNLERPEFSDLCKWCVFCAHASWFCYCHVYFYMFVHSPWMETNHRLRFQEDLLLKGFHIHIHFFIGHMRSGCNKTWKIRPSAFFSVPNTSLWTICLSCLVLLDCGFLCEGLGILWTFLQMSKGCAWTTVANPSLAM